MKRRVEKVNLRRVTFWIEVYVVILPNYLIIIERLSVIAHNLTQAIKGALQKQQPCHHGRRGGIAV